METPIAIPRRPPFSRSNLKTSSRLPVIEENSLIFLKPVKMCFDIDVEKLSLEALRDSLSRISFLLSKRGVIQRLPDHGHQLRLTKEKLLKEIAFRENLYATQQKIRSLSVKCASDSNIGSTYNDHLCSVERNPERERFRPNVARRSNSTGRTESMHELRSTQMLGLSESLALQKQQEARVKAEQMLNKQVKMAALAQAQEDESDTSDEEDSDETDASENETEDLEALSTVEGQKELKEAMKNFVFQRHIEETGDLNLPGTSGLQKAGTSAGSNTSSSSSSSDSADGGCFTRRVPPLYLGGNDESDTSDEEAGPK